MKGYFQKDTDFITNNEGIIYTFGLAADALGRKWWPDAPLSKFVCKASSPCIKYLKHPIGIAGSEAGRETMGDVPAKELAAYPQALSVAVALAVDGWWRRRVAPAHLQ